MDIRKKNNLNTKPKLYFYYKRKEFSKYNDVLDFIQKETDKILIAYEVKDFIENKMLAFNIDIRLTKNLNYVVYVCLLPRKTDKRA